MDRFFKEWGVKLIFVTVGTHEQPFNRLVEEVDRLKEEGLIEDEVVIQKGYSTFEPQNCTSFDLIGYEEMNRYMREARIIITHGGPASFLAPLALKKIPIVVPRQKKFNEHVNDHQLEFAKTVAERQKNIIVVENIHDLGGTIKNYNEIVCTLSSTIVSNTTIFNKEIIESVKSLFGE